MDKVLLIDAHNAMWRASIGFGPRKTIHAQVLSSNNNPVDKCECGGNWIDNKCDRDVDDSTITIFNFFRNLRPIIELFSPDKCFFVLEGHPKFRYDLYSEYKANRIVKTAEKKESKETFFRAKDEIVRLMQYLPITMSRAANYEADDVISTLCENMKDEDITILSNDSDYIQLLQKGYKNCSIYNPIKKEFMTAPEYPYVAWKCLNGDKADNIPSLLKPKKAIDTIKSVELFNKFMSIEENRANFNINRQLIEFRNIPEEEISLIDGKKDFITLKAEFSKLKFDSIINDTSWIKYQNTFNCLKY